MGNPEVDVRQGRPEDLDRVVRAANDAFADEAVVRWIAPDPEQRRELVGNMLRQSLVEALEEGYVLLAERPDGLVVAVSIWIELASAESIRQEAAALREATAEGADLAVRRTATVAALTAESHPDVPHLYLSAMAVSPACRGQGIGGRLLAERIGQADALGQPTYLEASTDDNRRLYARHGFRDLGSPIVLPDDGPRLRPMWRPGTE